MLKNKLVIAGPCSAENRLQVIQTAEAIKKISTDIIFRAGIWKPRTRPNSFEGIGEEGLDWLVEVNKNYHLKVATEVANPTHVQKVLEKGINIVWIGARTTVNPFYVQEIAEALKGTDTTVFIKNPTHPELALWEGAVERIEKAGIKNVGLIHRGFKTNGHHPYRNAPLWQLAIEMKVRHTNKPMICDISHICGNRTELLSVAQHAALIDYQGLHIETHIRPNEALTDAKQQITPEELVSLLQAVNWRNLESNQAAITLKNLREQINLIDEELLQLLGNRMNLAEKIGQIKKENNIPILQADYFKESLQQRFKEAKKQGLSEDFIQLLFAAIHFESINKQNGSTNLK